MVGLRHAAFSQLAPEYSGATERFTEVPPRNAQEPGEAGAKPPDPIPLPTRAQPLADLAIRYPSASGEFPEPFLLSVGPNDSAPRHTVLDANVIRDDLLKACRTSQTTALLESGARGGLRVYCAEHVPDEVDEHLPEWVSAIDLTEAKRVWELCYVPLLRVVDVPRDPPLTTDEWTRINVLREKDPDDVPTAILTLLINSPVASKDKPLLRAVYGGDADIDQLAEWLPRILAGRTIAEADQIIAAGVTLSNALASVAVGTIAEAVAGLRRMPKSGRTAAAIALALAVLTYREAATRQLRVLARAVLQIAGELEPSLQTWQVDRIEASKFLLQSMPAPAGFDEPDYEDVSGTLERSSLQVLASSVPLSAAAISTRLPPAVMPRSTAKVREVLRLRPYFHSLSRGRWQLGRPRFLVGTRHEK
jgi:predicted nucleic acid-binding protein